MKHNGLVSVFGKKYWLYPGKSMPMDLFLQCCWLLKISDDELVSQLKESKALVFALKPGEPPPEYEFEHGIPDKFDICPVNGQLSRTFEGWRYLDVRHTDIAECYLVDLASLPKYSR